MGISATGELLHSRNSLRGFKPQAGRSPGLGPGDPLGTMRSEYGSYACASVLAGRRAPDSESPQNRRRGLNRLERGMKRRYFGIVIPALAFLVALPGCGGGGSGDAGTVIVRTLSDVRADGGIGFTAPPPAGGTFTFSQASVAGSVQFGSESASASSPELRAFLDFPLDGSNGGGVLPLGARIVSADIEVFVRRVGFAATIPTLLDLVPFAIPLVAADFDSPPLTPTSFRNLNFFSTDQDNFVRIDVTALMAEAQRQGLRNLQLRFLRNASATTGLVEIADAGAAQAPLLSVEFDP